MSLPSFWVQDFVGGTFPYGVILIDISRKMKCWCWRGCRAVFIAHHHHSPSALGKWKKKCSAFSQSQISLPLPWLVFVNITTKSCCVVHALNKPHGWTTFISAHLRRISSCRPFAVCFWWCSRTVVDNDAFDSTACCCHSLQCTALKSRFKFHSASQKWASHEQQRSKCIDMYLICGLFLPLALLY